MSKIRVLPDILASQVAAGEVVERPASVVKELVENSIDAGAREVCVDIDQGGATLIRVTDDGCGMSREDALLSLERHATSKIRTSQDLATIRTLGFRGEAVPSIASVSKFRIITREPQSVAGTEIIVDGGKVRDVRDAGCAPGTTIEARSLFFNMPARKKFMRAETTESAHIEHQLRLHALAAPHVRFRFRKDNREVFDLPSAPRSVDRVRQLLGTDLSRELIPIPPTIGNSITIEGFVLPASHARKGRRHQFVFLNGRPVEDSVISRGLAEAFRGSITEGLHPAAWLWIDLEPTLVDVNVHPAKREVRFRRPVDVRDAIVSALTPALKPSPSPTPNSSSPLPHTPPPSFFSPTSSRPSLTPSIPLPSPSPPPPSPAVESNPSLQPYSPPAASWLPPAQTTLDLPAPTTPTPSQPSSSNTPPFRLLGLIQNRFFALESADGLVMFDPKAAAERITYEKLLHHANARPEVQSLLVPVLMELDPRDTDLILREHDSLTNSGIEIDHFGGNTIQIRAIPACIPISDPRALIGEILDDILHAPSQGARFTHERIAKIIAKKSATRTTARLSEAFPLLNDLFLCELPYCTPDGRPTLSEWNMKEIEKRFGL